MEKLEGYFAGQPQHLVTEESRSRREVAYERIKDALKHAGLNPGEPLSEPGLSRLLGISRTPIREALQQLAQEGLVQVIPGRAVTVASRSLNDVLDVVHVRSLLEPELARLAADNATARQIELLQTAIRGMEQAMQDDDYAAWSKADNIFHEVIGQACPNQLLGENVVMLRNRVHHLANMDSKVNPVRLAACTAEHRQVVEAIARHDGKAAEQAMREHLARLRESLFARLSYG
ncbi:MAG: GntR family transcriptional regulator [Anaerolineae bacterium]|nr:GntR family transcriptional regulator [Anaerolineae bacterium]